MKCDYCKEETKEKDFHISHIFNFDIICIPCEKKQREDKKQLREAIKKYSKKRKKWFPGQ